MQDVVLTDRSHQLKVKCCVVLRNNSPVVQFVIPVHEMSNCVLNHVPLKALVARLIRHVDNFDGLIAALLPFYTFLMRPKYFRCQNSRPNLISKHEKLKQALLVGTGTGPFRIAARAVDRIVSARPRAEPISELSESCGLVFFKMDLFINSLFEGTLEGSSEKFEFIT